MNLSLTDKAKEKIQEILSKNPGKYLRVVIDGFGWGGPRLGLALDEPDANEVPVKVDDIDVLISDQVKAFAKRSSVDYVKTPYREGFTIDSEGC